MNISQMNVARSNFSAADSGIAMRFDAAMRAEAGATSASAPCALSAGGGGAAGGMNAEALTSILDQMKQLIQQLAQLIQAMSSQSQSDSPVASSGAGGSGGRAIMPVSGGGDGSGLGGTHGPSERIPDPTQNVREIQLGGKTMTIGSDGSASAAEVGAATAEMQRMYSVSPTFRSTIDNSGAENLTMTLGRRSDNTSWGGGGRVFLNLNNVQAGNNDTFQGLVGHEFAHAASGLPHGAELDSIEDRVRAEA